MKTQGRNVLAILLFMVCLSLFSQRADAAPNGKKVMVITAKTAGYTVKAPVYAVESSWGGYSFEMESDTLDLVLKKKTILVTVSVNVLRKNIVVAGSPRYKKKVRLNDSSSLYQELDFQYYWNGQPQSTRVYYRLSGHMLNLSVDNLYLTVNSGGFHPGSGGYMPIQVNLSAETWNLWGSLELRLRILNSKGNYVFQKTYQANSGGYLRFRWDGKASKKNTAGVKAGAYVPDGKYKVEAYYFYKKAGSETFAKKLKPVTVRKSFTVSSKAPSGTSGIAKAKELPIYTGNSTIDYLADCMIKEAGITSSTSADEKVKKIYHYMTTHFKHIHYDSEEKRTVYYNTAKLASKIKKYEKSSLKSYKEKKILYSYDVGYALEEHMTTRSGVCNDHADIFALLCRHVGIDAGICSGYYLNRNGTRAGHSWNYAVVNGVTWYYDIDVEIQNYGKGQGDYYWYKKTRAQANQTHDFQHIY